MMGELMRESKYITIFTFGIIIAAITIGINQVYILNISNAVGLPIGTGDSTPALASVGPGIDLDVSDEDMDSISSTAQALATVFPDLHQVNSEEEITDILLPGNTPEYSNILGGATFADPEMSLQYLSQWNAELKQEVRRNDPDAWERFLDLAASPKGISCEFCCGIQAEAVDNEGNTQCGCAHQPALEAVTLGLLYETDMSDAEVLREVLKWKSTYFPRDMVRLGAEVSGQDPDQITGEERMVGGC